MAFEVDDSTAPAPRMCHLIRWHDFDGYGFNLHSIKGRLGQFIGRVDRGSPAEAAGLQEGDRIVEVNGVNIANENHKQVVERIKAVPESTRLLVVDADTDNWHRDHKLVIRGTQKNVIYLQSPATQTGASTNTTASLIGERLSPVTADRRSSTETPSKSGSLHVPSPQQPQRRKSSVLSFEHKVIDSHTVVPLNDTDNIKKDSVFNFPVTEVPSSSSAPSPPANMIEKYHETITSVDVYDSKDELAARPVGFRVVSHDQGTPTYPDELTDPAAPPMPISAIPELKSSLMTHHVHSVDELVQHSQVHFSPSTADSLDEVDGTRTDSGSPAPPVETFVAQPNSGTGSQETYEIRRVLDSPVRSIQHTPLVDETSHKSSDSSSTSSRSIETDQLAPSISPTGKHDDSSENHDDLGFDETKTPSPSPAVVPDSYRPPVLSPYVPNGFHAGVSAKERDATGSMTAPLSAPPVVAERTLPPAVKTVSSPAPPISNFDGLGLNVTAQEMRETLSRRRKADPRSQPIDMRKKFDMINNM